MRAFVRLIDYLLRKSLGVYDFSQAEGIILRLQITRAPHELRFSENVISAGEPVLGIHLWNERVPRIPPQGPDLAWAMRVQRMLVHTLKVIAQKVQKDQGLAGLRAIGAITGTLSPLDSQSGIRALERLGFRVTPYKHPLGCFGEFWDNLYSWWLMWTFNPVSLRHRHFFHLQRMETWMPMDEFIARYGASEPVSER